MTVHNPDCLFCKIASGEIPADVVYRDDDLVAFRDINPQAPTHILIIPTRHIARVSDATADDLELLGSMVLRAAEIARGEGIEDGGYRLVLNNGAGAGQSVWHVHMHVLGGRRMGWPPG